MELPNISFKIAVTQFSPVFLDKKATVDKAIRHMEQAAKNGAKLIVFPEAFIPGYPDWVWTVPAGNKAQLNELYTKLLNNAISIPDETTMALGKAAKKYKMIVAMGINERNSEASNASLYNTILFIDQHGRIIGKHRKLIPTGGERLIWAQGDGSTLEVYDTPLGKIGSLICWENYMPLARAALYSWGIQIYLAPTWDSSEVWLSGLRHIAKEGGVFVAGCCMAIKKSEILGKYEFGKNYSEEKKWINVGNSCIVNPKGDFIAGPLSAKQDILYADISLDDIPANKWILDTAGHYARPDIFKLMLDKSTRPLTQLINRNSNKNQN
ncbi:MAG: carbon-nitrogen hydrolase family protein [Calditrichota bacterium]|jgi:nitrilase